MGNLFHGVSYPNFPVMRLFSLVLTTAAFYFLLATPVFALTVNEIASQEPIKVELSVFLNDINRINTVDQNFEANFFFEARWHDPGQVHASPCSILRPLNETWRPDLQVINQQKAWESFPEMVEVTPDGQVTYRQRLWGNFSQKLFLKDFPFDRQSFTVQFVASGFSSGQIVLVSDNGRKTGMAETLSESDWEILGWHAGSNVYTPIPGNEGQPGFAFTIEAQRKKSYYLLKVIMPLILIVMMSWVAFWIDPTQSGIDISVAITSMLTLIAYRFAIGTFLPVISYLTRLDLFILGSTLLVFSSLVEVVVTCNLVRSGHTDLAYTIDRVSRWVFPMVFVYVLVQSLYLPLPGWK